MSKRVMVASDFSAYRHMMGTIISARTNARLVVLDALPNHPMVFEVRELIWC